MKSLPRNREKHAGQHIGVFLQPAADSWQWRFWDVLNQRNYQTPLRSCCFGMILYLLNQKKSERTFHRVPIFIDFWAWQKPFVQTWCLTMHKEIRVSSDPVPEPPYRCGSPVIGKELSKQSHLNSDLVGTPGETRFSFFKDGIDRHSKHWTDENYKRQPQLTLWLWWCSQIRTYFNGTSTIYRWFSH